MKWDGMEWKPVLPVVVVACGTIGCVSEAERDLRQYFKCLGARTVSPE
jgi:hypothetical protein